MQHSGSIDMLKCTVGVGGGKKWKDQGVLEDEKE